MDYATTVLWSAADWAAELWAWTWGWCSFVLAPPLSLAASVLLPTALVLAALFGATVLFLWWLHRKLVQLGEGPHATAFTPSCTLTTTAAIGVAPSAEIESALYLPAVTISERLASGIWSSSAVCKVYIEQVRL